ncbi:18168_t:CDS:1 [Gigaspora margarita]|uniref:18168_t:CDS:1 n=1 Tax=Gigaspora margarita TaxID=4874 RepID=A0ABN7UX76_GIGMA|nr:18168_t:CDS:1 [Gigaspora margarita]
MSYSGRRQRGPYAINACINCRRKHIKCSEGIICTNCASHNLQCIYVKSVKKRGPRTVNNFESNFDEAASIEQEHTLISTEYQFNTFTPYFKELQPIQTDFFRNQVHIGTNFIMQNNIPVNYNDTFSLPQPIQSDFFRNKVHIGTNFIMQNNIPVTYNDTFSLLQPIQNDFFRNQVHIDTNLTLQNNNTPINYNDTFSLSNSSFSFSSSIASNLDYFI